MNSDFGPDDILRAYELRAITKKLGGYNYVINLLGSIVQGDVLIGNFKSMKMARFILIEVPNAGMAHIDQQ